MLHFAGTPVPARKNPSETFWKGFFHCRHRRSGKVQCTQSPQRSRAVIFFRVWNPIWFCTKPFAMFVHLRNHWRFRTKLFRMFCCPRNPERFCMQLSVSFAIGTHHFRFICVTRIMFGELFRWLQLSRSNSNTSRKYVEEKFSTSLIDGKWSKIYKSILFFILGY